MTLRRRLVQAAVALAKPAAASRGPVATTAAAFQHATNSAACTGLPRAQFPWAKVSLGFAAAGLMTVAEPPSAGCTSTAVKADGQCVETVSTMQAAAPPLPAVKPQDGSVSHKVVFVLGGPGSGKGTQSARLVEEFGLVHLSAGDLLRAHMKSGSPEGQMVADMIKDGKIVPSHVTISLLQQAMDDSGKHKFLIDGFPRNEENRSSFESQTGIQPELVLFFDCPEEVMERRLLGRNEGRTDDNMETIRKRFKVFIESSLPVIQHYEALGKVARINADRSADDIYKEVRRLVVELQQQADAMGLQAADGSDGSPRASGSDNSDLKGSHYAVPDVHDASLLDEARALINSQRAQWAEETEGWTWYTWLGYYWDVAAGLSTGAMVIPQGMSYANLAGLPYVFGLYGAFVPCIVYAFLGTSRQLVVGPVAVTSILLGNGLSDFMPTEADPNNPVDPQVQENYNHAAIQIAFIAGCFYTAFGLFRMGWITNFLSSAMISGFMSGASITIALSQVKYILGLKIPRTDTLQDSLDEIFSNLSQFKWREFCMGMSFIFLLLSFQYLSRAYKRRLNFLKALGPLTVCVISIALMNIFDWYNPKEKPYIKPIGNIPSGLPGFTGTWWLPLFNVGRQMTLAVLICFIDVCESISIAKALARVNKYQLNYTQELRGLGIANLFGAMFSCYTTTGSFSRSAVNNSVGAQTPLANLTTGLMLMVTLLWITPVFKNMSQNVQGAIIIVGVLALFDYNEFIYLWKINKFDWLVWVVCFLTVLFAGVEIGIGVGVGLSIVVVIYKVAFPRISQLGRLPNSQIYRSLRLYPEAEETPGVLLLRVDAPLLFFNIEGVKEYVRKEITKSRADGKKSGIPVRVVVLDLAPVTDVDATGIHFLDDLVDELKEQEIHVVLGNPSLQVLVSLKRAHLDRKIGRSNLHVGMADAVAQAVFLVKEHQKCTMAAAPAPDTPGGANFMRWLQFRVSGSSFEVPSSYQLVKPIGKGAYGIVCAAVDTRTNQQVAIKKIGDIFSNPLDARRTLREIQILRHVRGHSNVITLLDLFPPSVGLHDFRDVYIVYEIMDTDVHQIIRSPQPLSEDHVQFFVYQLLRGLKYLHSAGVVHRDLKPSNLLLNGNCELRICDFGLARAEVNNRELMAEYVVTRWYRAPELLLSCSDYGMPIDMWSVGCIFAELLGRKPLFPGKDFVHQLNMVCKVIGTPTAAEIAAVPSDKARAYLASMPYFPKGDMHQYFPSASPLAIDLLDRLLAFDPAKRLTVAQALAHPWLASLHDPNDEPVCDQPFNSPEEQIGEPSLQQIRDGIPTVALAIAADDNQPEQLAVYTYPQLMPARLLRRYKRFLGDVAFAGAELAAADFTTIHVPNTGPMTGLLDTLPAEALLSVSSDPKRKYAHTLEFLRDSQGTWVGTHSAKANAMVRVLLEQRLLTQLPTFDTVQSEVKYGADGKSRVDFVLHTGTASAAAASGGAGSAGSAGSKRRRGSVAAGSMVVAGAQATASCYLEVKSVTLAEDRPEGGRIALFPDTVSERAQRHVRELTALVRAGGSAACVFVVQRGDCCAFAPCHEKDPKYGQLLQVAAAAGVQLIAVVCKLDEATGCIRHGGTLPIDLRYKLPVSVGRAASAKMAGQEALSPVPKRARTNGSREHRIGSTYNVTGLQLTDHTLTVPLDHTGKSPGTIDVFFRELVHRNKKDDKGLGYLLFLQGGPGFEAARPTELSGWMKQASVYFRIILLDQRGTGSSTPITPDNLPRQGSPEEQARYLKADSIVRDAELVRHAIVPQSSSGGRWSILGQSFGGFCCATYLSLAPEGLVEALITGGIPPGITQPCCADDVYRRTFRRAIQQNGKFYQRFPMDVERRIVKHLAQHPDGGVLTPMGNKITPRSLQLLGLQTLGFSHGFERLHYLIECAWDGDSLSHKFKKEFDSWSSWDTNPLYALLHESIYCQGAASRWESEYAAEFDAVARATSGQPVLFTGEMVFPWMFDEFAQLRNVKEAAEIVAYDADWPTLYNVQRLEENTVPVATATYYEDMFVDFELGQVTAGHIKGIRQWITNEFLHCGIREAGVTIVERLLNMSRGGILLR
ncbi:Proton/sulfate cotransporter 2 [Chlorella vulgaris]